MFNVGLALLPRPNLTDPTHAHIHTGICHCACILKLLVSTVTVVRAQTSGLWMWNAVLQPLSHSYSRTYGTELTVAELLWTRTAGTRVCSSHSGSF